VHLEAEAAAAKQEKKKKKKQTEEEKEEQTHVSEGCHQPQNHDRPPAVSVKLGVYERSLPHKSSHKCGSSFAQACPCSPPQQHTPPTRSSPPLLGF